MQVPQQKKKENIVAKKVCLIAKNNRTLTVSLDPEGTLLVLPNKHHVWRRLLRRCRRGGAERKEESSARHFEVRCGQSVVAPWHTNILSK